MFRNSGLALTKRKAESTVATSSVEFSNSELRWPVLSATDSVGSLIWGDSRMGFTIDASAPFNRLDLCRLGCFDRRCDSSVPYGLRFGATKGLVSLSWRLFLAEDVS